MNLASYLKKLFNIKENNKISPFTNIGDSNQFSINQPDKKIELSGFVPFDVLTNYIKNNLSAFKNAEKIIINKTDINTDAIKYLVKKLPNIKELELKHCPNEKELNKEKYIKNIQDIKKAKPSFKLKLNGKNVIGGEKKVKLCPKISPLSPLNLGKSAKYRAPNQQNIG